MELFQAQKGFTHFVFADPKDSYLLPSLVRLDLNGYLYTLLSKCGYRNIFFINGLEGMFCLQLCDSASREVYERLGRKAGFWEKLTQDTTASRTYPLSNGDLPKRFINILKKSRDTAFVFRLDSFYEIFSPDRGLLREFVRTGQKYLEQNGNILLLQMPVTASGSLKYLTDRQGIFVDMDGVSLCPEVSQIMAQGHNVKLYEQLARDMGERCVFLNELTPELAYQAVEVTLLRTQPDWNWSCADVENMAAFLATWYRSAALRQQTGPILSEPFQLRTLLDELSDSTRRWSIRRAMEALGQPLPEKLKQYPQETTEAPILSDSLLAKKIRQIRLPEMLYTEAPELGKLIINRFSEVVRQFQIPRSHPCDPELEKVLMQCMFTLENAAGKGDIQTLERAVKFLSAAVERNLRYGEDEGKLWRYRTTILQLSEDAFKLDGTIREDTDQIIHFTKKKKELIRQIEAQKSMVGGVFRGVTAQEHELSVQMHQAVDLDKLIENLTRSRAVKQERRNRSLTTLHDLELAAGSLGLGLSRDVEQVFRDALNAVEREAVSHQQSEAKLHQLDRSMDLVMQEMPGKSDGVDLLEEYEKMLGSLEDEPLLLLD